MHLDDRALRAVMVNNAGMALYRLLQKGRDPKGSSLNGGVVGTNGICSELTDGHAVLMLDGSVMCYN